MLLAFIRLGTYSFNRQQVSDSREILPKNFHDSLASLNLLTSPTVTTSTCCSPYVDGKVELFLWIATFLVLRIILEN